MIIAFPVRTLLYFEYSLDNLIFINELHWGARARELGVKYKIGIGFHPKLVKLFTPPIPILYLTPCCKIERLCFITQEYMFLQMLDQE